MELILHVGTHKTGTTSIQRFLSNNREKLLESKIWYPKYSEVIDTQADHYSHLDIPKALMNQSKMLTSDEAELFLSILYDRANELNVEKVILSAETFMRGELGNSNRKWQRIQDFISKLHSLIGFGNVKIVFCFRNLLDYLTSLFNEHIKSTNFREDIHSFHNQFVERFNYPLLVSKWSEKFANVQCIEYDSMGKGKNFINSFLLQVLNLESLQNYNYEEKSRNVSWPIPVVELKRKLNQSNCYVDQPTLRSILTNYSSSGIVSEENYATVTWLTKSERQNFISSYRKKFKDKHIEIGLKDEYIFADNLESKVHFSNISEKIYLDFINNIFKMKLKT